GSTPRSHRTARRRTGVQLRRRCTAGGDEGDTIRSDSFSRGAVPTAQGTPHRGRCPFRSRAWFFAARLPPAARGRTTSRIREARWPHASRIAVQDPTPGCALRVSAEFLRGAGEV